MIEQRQNMKQQLKLSPQQLLLMKLLQIPATALEQSIKEEMERNPMLEDSTTEASADDPAPSTESEENAEPSDDNPESEPDEAFPSNDEDDEENYVYRDSPSRDTDEDARPLVISSQRTLADHLTEQFTLLPHTSNDLLIAKEIIGSLDDAGYLTRDTNLIANDITFRQGLEVSPEEVQAVLTTIQGLDPAGIAARNLQECLSLQLHRLPDSPVQESATAIVDRFFDAFTKHQYDRIQSRLGLDTASLNKAIDLIRRLNPKPASAFAAADTTAPYIFPDFILTDHDGQLDFHLNTPELPELHVSRYYTRILRELTSKASISAADNETIQFIRNKSQAAQNFIDTLHQRQQTLSDIMAAILRYQYDYLRTGDVTKLRPMRLKDVSQITGYDISTISRVVSQKHLQTPFGTILLKELFTKSMSTQQGEEVSAEAIRHAIATAVASEDKQRPLTDEQLTALLQQQGYNVARRTTAKYRDQLGIPIGRLRKAPQQ